ncbi:MAG TPA: ABC transporter ATP-binding protein, partial [Chloroflexia bacterium]|nr:ABC transporter ATP-binding protein [Chloroflexia bacterium]
PLSNLDAKLRNEMRIEIKRLHQLLKLTTVYVTHDQTEAMSLSDQVVVMRQGRIEQVGTPQEIYHRPRSLYVADFMGYANRLPVEIVDRTGGEWCVRTASGALLRATCTLEESGAWPAGRAVVACCRPDETLAGAPAGANRQAGQVQVVEYLGKGFESLVRLADAGDRPFLVQSTHPVPVGEFIDFGVPPDRLLLFPREAPAGAAATPALMAPREPALAGGR